MDGNHSDLIKYNPSVFLSTSLKNHKSQYTEFMNKLGNKHNTESCWQTLNQLRWHHVFRYITLLPHYNACLAYCFLLLLCVTKLTEGRNIR
jgi:hypothetical protein